MNFSYCMYGGSRNLKHIMLYIAIANYSNDNYV